MFATKQFIVDEIGEPFGPEWFLDDFVRFQKDSVHSTLHVGVPADQQRKCLRLRMAHRGNYRKAITGVCHVEISD